MWLECLLGAVIITLLLIIISVIMGVDKAMLSEHMTRIRRTVGTYNSGNDQQVAPGMIDSMAIMDYRYTWTDGRHVFSCDECPNKQSCPHCPQYRASSIQSMTGGYENFIGTAESRIAGKGLAASNTPLDSVLPGDQLSGGESADPGAGSELFKAPVESRHAQNPMHTEALKALGAPVRSGANGISSSTEHEFRQGEHDAIDRFDMVNSLGPAYDLDPNFVSSRERMGAGCSVLSGTRARPHKVSIRGMTYDATDLGTRNDDIFDGERSTGHMGIDRSGRQNACPTGKSSLKLLYTNVMGLTNPPPYDASCEFLGAQGYLYKETCALGTTYP